MLTAARSFVTCEWDVDPGSTAGDLGYIDFEEDLAAALMYLLRNGGGRAAQHLYLHRRYLGLTLITGVISIKSEPSWMLSAYSTDKIQPQ